MFAKRGYSDSVPRGARFESRLSKNRIGPCSRLSTRPSPEGSDVAHGRMLAEHCFKLSEFDTEAAEV